MSHRRYLDLCRKYMAGGRSCWLGRTTFGPPRVSGARRPRRSRPWPSIGAGNTKGTTICRRDSRLVGETGDVELGRLFSVAERLHASHYGGFATPRGIEAYVDDVRRLVGKLRGLLGGRYHYSGWNLKEGEADEVP